MFFIVGKPFKGEGQVWSEETKTEETKTEETKTEETKTEETKTEETKTEETKTEEAETEGASAKLRTSSPALPRTQNRSATHHGGACEMGSRSV